jgi:retron-type reverse transcriptase
MERLSRLVADKAVLRLIRSYLQAGVMSGGVIMARDEGTPQGGPLSPILANVLLDEVDQALTKRGHRCSLCRRLQRLRVQSEGWGTGTAVDVKAVCAAAPSGERRENRSGISLRP